MSRFLVASTPFAGHVYPMVGHAVLRPGVEHHLVPPGHQGPSKARHGVDVAGERGRGQQQTAHGQLSGDFESGARQALQDSWHGSKVSHVHTDVALTPPSAQPTSEIPAEDVRK